MCDTCKLLLNARVPDKLMRPEDAEERLKLIAGGKFDSTYILWEQADYLLAELTRLRSLAGVSV